jgi:hypothetical protein
MANETKLIVDGTQLCFCDAAGDFSPTAANDLRVGTPNTVQISMASIANGAARQSAKTASANLMNANSELPTFFRVDAVIETGATVPTDGATIDFYWSGSNSATAGTANMGTASGSDAAFTVANSELGQLQYIGSLVCSDEGTTGALIQQGHVGDFSPRHEFGSLIMVNNCGQTLETNDVEMHVVFTPMSYRPAA